MFSFTQLFALASIVVTAGASTCVNKSVISSTDIGSGVKSTKFQCDRPSTGSALKARQDPNVCGAICNISCNGEASGLPPVIDDCTTIVDSVKILESVNDIPTTFTVDAGQRQELTFETCTIFFDNLSAETLTSCFSDLVTEASAAGAACFPPNSPLIPEGDCIASDGTWVAAAAHSDDN